MLCVPDAAAQGLRAQRFRGIQLVGPTESGQNAQKNQGVALLAPPSITTSYALILPGVNGAIGQSLVVGSTDGTNAAFLTWTTPLTAATGWTLPGNVGAVSTGLIGTVPTGARLGTIDANDLRIVTDNRVRMIITSAGAISVGGLTSINDNLNSNTNINTGTSSGIVNIGSSASTTAILGTTTINATGVAGTTIGNTNPTTGVAINSGSTGRLSLGGLPTVTSSSDDVLLISNTNQVSRITQVNLFGNAWEMTGKPITDPVNQYLGSNNAAPLVIRTNALERLRITSNGLVQIGAASGSSTLNVTGTFDLTGNATIGGSLAVTGLITGSSGGSITGATNINTTGTSSTTIGNASSTTSVTGTVNVNTSGNGNTTIGNSLGTGITTIATSGAAGQLRVTGLETPTTSSNDVMLINGTTGQVQKITQANLFAGQGWALTGNSITAGGTGANQQFIGTTNAQPLVIATTLAQPIQLFTNNAERARISSAGFLGIATTNPAQKIHVGGATDGEVFGIAFGNQGSGLGALLAKNNSASQAFDFFFGRHSNQTGAQLRFYRDQATEVVRFMGNGDVGIGVFPPARRLDVAGTFGATGLITGTGGATISGAVTSINDGSNFATNINTGSSTGNVTIGGTGTMSILIGNGTGIQTISLGDGITGAKTVTLGSTGGTSTTTIQSGSGSVNINNNNNQATNINTGSSTGAVNIGTGTNSGTVTIGRTGGTLTTIGSLGHTGAATITGATNINTTGNGNTTIGNATTT
ncbi:MAG: beta strand repeat-containing protein, partial [Bacteroidota bacterium]